MKAKVVFIIFLTVFFAGIILFLIISKMDKNDCILYSDYKGKVSIYDYQFFSEKSDNKCMNSTTDQIKGNIVTKTLIEMYKHEVEDFYKNKYNINDSCNIKVEGNAERIKLEDLYVGYLISYDVASDCEKEDKFTLQCLTSTSCIIK